MLFRSPNFAEYSVREKDGESRLYNKTRVCDSTVWQKIDSVATESTLTSYDDDDKKDATTCATPCTPYIEVEERLDYKQQCAVPAPVAAKAAPVRARSLDRKVPTS